MYGFKDFAAVKWWEFDSNFNLKPGIDGFDGKCRRKIYIFITSVPEVYGGRTKSVLQRASILHRFGQADVTICTTNFNPNYARVHEALVRRGSVDSGVKFSNLYEFFMQDAEGFDSNNYKKILPVDFSTSAVKEVDGDFDCIDDRSGKVYKLIHDCGTGLLSSIVVSDVCTGNKLMCHYLDDRGNLARTVEYDSQGGRGVKLAIYDRQGFVFLTKPLGNYNSKRREKILILNRLGEVRMAFRDDDEVLKYYVRRVCRRYSFLISDVRSLDFAVASVEKNCKINYFVHSNHISSSAVGSKLKSSYEYLVNESDEKHRVIALTAAQSEDIQKILKYDAKRRMHVIPHTIGIFDELCIEEGFRNHVFVVISRLDPDKRVDLCVRAFARAVKIYPNIHLEIYGHGADEQKLKDIVKDLDCDENISFMGYTLNVGKVFSSAVASINTSKAEGFCLSILESLCFGCPVISFDVKYGPSDLIINGKSGYLVENNNIEKLVESIGMAYQGGITMSRRQISESVSRFDLKNFVKNWISLVNS